MARAPVTAAMMRLAPSRVSLAATPAPRRDAARPHSNARRPVSHQPPSRFAIAVCVLLALVGSVGAVGSWGAYLTDSRLERSGPRAVGLVTDAQVSRAADGETDYIVKYTFALPSGREVLAQRGVSQRLWSQLRRGERVTVVYSAEHPGRNFPLGAGVTSLGLTIFGSLLSAAVAALGYAVLFGVWRERRRH